jgi:gluconate 2-dehydrogenase gamma chain
MSDQPTTDRRSLLKLVGASVGVASLPGIAAAAPAPKQGVKARAPHPPQAKPMAMPEKKVSDTNPVYIFLNGDEAAFVEAFVDTLIPADEFTAKGTDLGVAIFVDRQLASGWGRGAKMYLQGPFLEGTPEQGYQLPLPPSELIRTGIADLNAYVRKTHGGNTFDTASEADRIAIVTALEQHQVELDTVPAVPFFAMLFQLVMDGFFADPIYGGNKGKASWKMLGYPGVGEMYADKVVPWRNKPYRVEPKSIQDLA